MPWPFIGRTDQLDRIRRVFAEPRPGPVMVLGEPGMGRSSLLAAVLARTSLSPDDTVLRVEPAGRAPFAAVAGLLPAGFTDTAGAVAGTPDTIAEAADVLARRAGGRRLVIVFDDAHRADMQTMQALRHLNRAYGAPLLVTAVNTGALPPGPDPLDCLRYEPGACTMRMPPLSTDEVAMVLTEVLGGPVRATTVAALHAATEGSPGLLHDLVTQGRLTDLVVMRDGLFQLATGERGHPVGTTLPEVRQLTDHLVDPLVSAVGKAWRELALDQTDELCRLASWLGLARSVADNWAAVLLLRGRVADGLRVLDQHVPASHGGSPRVAVTRALLVGLGLGQVSDAENLLVDAAHADLTHRERLLACRAWLLAVTGMSSQAAVACESVAPGEDREARMFCRAAHAAVALAAGRAHEAVSHLRRALAAADALRAVLPWFRPHLTACLIDALLMAGRISEATAEATEFHAGRRGSGWNVAVAFDRLLTTRRGASTNQVLVS